MADARIHPGRPESRWVALLVRAGVFLGLWFVLGNLFVQIGALVVIASGEPTGTMSTSPAFRTWNWASWALGALLSAWSYRRLIRTAGD